MAEQNDNAKTAIGFDAASPEERQKFKMWCIEHNTSMRIYLQQHIAKLVKDYTPNEQKIMQML